MAEINPSKLHAIMISVPFQGHINPFVNLALKIASKGLAVTFVHFESIHHRLSKAHHNNKTDVDLFSEARKSGLDIRYTTIGDDFPLEFDRDLNFPEYWNYLCRQFPARADEFIAHTIRSDPSSVHFLVADAICTWPAKVADKYKLVNAAFWTEPAYTYALACHWDVIREKGHGPCKDNVEVEIDYVPGVESISTKDIMTYITDADSIVAEGLFVAFMDAKKADFMLINTVQELEHKTISALNKFQPNYAIGPVNFFKNPVANTVSKSFWTESDCTSWLGSKPAGSVLYVSFGSLVLTTKRVMEEIAYGLLLSGVNFIWVVRERIVGADDDSSVLPVGFEDEMIKDNKGLIVTWCDQIKVLSDRAVGGFVTHNGWNSTVESMWCGVPMICYPIAWDQFTTRKLVVDDWKIGIRLCDGDSFVDRTQVAERIKTFMWGDSSQRMRREAEKVKDKLRGALESGGSSEGNFDQFIEDLKKKLCMIECYNI